MSTENEEHKPAAEGDEPLIAEADRVNVGMIAIVTLAIVGVTVAVVIGVQQFFNETWRGEKDKKLLSYVDPRITDTTSLETAHFTKYQWVSQKDGLVRIPRERARELVLAEYGKLPAYVPGSEAAPTPAPAPAPEPSTSASAAASGSASAAPPAGSTSAAPPVPASASASAAPHGSASAHH